MNPTSLTMESKVAIAGTHCGKGRNKSNVFMKENLHFFSKEQHPDVFHKGLTFRPLWPEPH